MNGTAKPRIKTRRIQPADIPRICEVQQAAYADLAPDALCEPRHYELQLAAFPEGQICAEVDGQIVGYATSLIVQLDDQLPLLSYSEMTGAGTFTPHNPSGDTLFGADIAVHPDWRGKGVASRLYRERKAILRRYNLRRMVAGGRIPGYKAHAAEMTPEDYVERVVRGELTDPALTVHLRAGYQVRGLQLDYVQDASSLNYATYLEMPNPDYHPERRRIAAAPLLRPVRIIRVCAAQYQMRPVRTWEEFEHQVEFFVTSADEYHCHFLLFPELFTAQLFSILDPALETSVAIKELASMTDRYLEMFRRLARQSGLHIIGGTHPVPVGERIRNVAHLFTPSGNVYRQEKLHVTPGERRYWGIERGRGLFVFDTGLARVAILVCYDIEFPELARLLTLAGAEVIFCPFSTDERKSYIRVRACGQARAIENWVYVVLAGNVGNLPQVRSFLLNYGQAVIFTPSDFAFPARGIAGEADPNTETVVITELDLGTLALQREIGSVRPLHDRRLDLYELSSREKVEVIRTV